MPASHSPAPPPAPSAPPAGSDPRRADTAAALDGVRRVVRALRLAAGGAESATGLSAAQLFVLQAVRAEPGCSLSELAGRTLTDRTSVAAVVARLAEQGLVERRRSAVDGRRVEVMATPAAHAVLARAPHPPTRRLLDGLAGLSDRDLGRLADGLTSLVRAMGLDAEPAAMLFEDGRAADDPLTAERPNRTRPTPPRGQHP